MNSLWDIRIFLGLVPKESPRITVALEINYSERIPSGLLIPSD
jgi:hypothetical protein